MKVRTVARDRVALLSVRPRFADALVDGTKTVEIRRRRALITDGAICLLYASSPVCAVIGAVRVDQTDVDTIERLWNRWGDKSALLRSEYDSYITGSAKPCAIVIGAAVRLDEPIPLPVLRQRQQNFVTPQSYRFLTPGELESITNGQGRQLALLHPDAGPHEMLNESPARAFARWRARAGEPGRSRVHNDAAAGEPGAERHVPR
jgi:predicted transcriptional regulator